MYGMLIIGLAFAATLAFGGIQTWNLRACQRQATASIVQHTLAIERQNEKVKGWEAAATAARARAAEATRLAEDARAAAKAREEALLAETPPPADATCEARELAIRQLIRRYRAP